MTNLHQRPTEPDSQRRLIHITPESADWEYVGFDLHRLKAGETVTAETAGREVCLVFLTGKGRTAVDGTDLGVLGERMSVFDGKPWSLYVPAGAQWSIAAETDLDVAACSAPGNAGSHPARVIRPDSHDVMTRGKGNNIRYVTDIINETDEADGLLVVEVITPAGNASSYPPHKHDRDAFPEETRLEEVYYHRINPPQGFGFQRIYTDDRSLDVSMTIE
ncbi:MAG: 5-deoxy-glucuronate isomerase, partial [Hyphomicrobiales bacterium]|nr:5-deoxy-glucuronate isomerase [Hyphomicrobiales bacterium]